MLRSMLLHDIIKNYLVDFLFKMHIHIVIHNTTTQCEESVLDKKIKLRSSDDCLNNTLNKQPKPGN